MHIFAISWLKEYQDLKEEMETLRWKIEKSETDWIDVVVGGDLSKARILKRFQSGLESEIERLKCFLGEKELAEEALVSQWLATSVDWIT